MDYGAIGIGVGIAGVMFAGLAWSLSGRALKFQMLAELMREYAHPAMGQFVERLWVFYVCVCFQKEDTLMDQFAERLRDADKLCSQDDVEAEEDSVNKARRQVSHFYQRMAALHIGRSLPDKVLYRIWREKDLRIIPKIIIPLEKALIKSQGETPDEKDYELLTKLYEHSKGPGRTIF
jgi:hypothetical protein